MKKIMRMPLGEWLGLIGPHGVMGSINLLFLRAEEKVIYLLTSKVEESLPEEKKLVMHC